MGVLADLVPRAQPALVGRGCTGEATEGASWLFILEQILNDAGTAINLTGVTGSAVILDGPGGSTVATLTYTGFSDGHLTLALADTATAGLAAGNTDHPRRCAWSLTLDDGTDTVQFWGPTNSPFYIWSAS